MGTRTCPWLTDRRDGRACLQRRRYLSPTAAAAKLGVSLEHIRYATQLLHRPRTPRPKNPPGRRRKVRPRAADILTADFFQREHLQGGKDLSTLSAETGYASPTLRRYARQAGIELVTADRRERIPAPRPRLRDRIDPGWLREQVVIHNRTHSDIGAELGVSHETIRRRLKDLDIAGHAFGSAGHVVTNLRHPELPHGIRRAVEGQRNGWQRLQRFQQMLAYPSMNSAAKAMGLHMQNLNLQIQRLERDVGTPLLQRAPHRYAPMAATKHGQRILDHLAQPYIRDLLDRYASSNASLK